MRFLDPDLGIVADRYLRLKGALVLARYDDDPFGDDGVGLCGKSTLDQF